MAIRLPASLIKSSHTKSFTSKALKNAGIVATAMTLGDVGCQAVETWGHFESFSWDTARTMRMAFTGAFVTTPMSYAWNLCAERVAPGTSWSAVLKKLVVQVAAMPPMLAAQFTTLTLLEEGKTMDDARHRLSQDFVPTMEVSMCYWPAVGIICSRFVPVMNRPAASSLAGVFWNIYLSHQANHNGLELGEVISVTSSEDLPTPVAISAEDKAHESATVNNAPDMGRRGASTSSSTPRREQDASTGARHADERVDGDDKPRPRELKRKLARRTTFVSM